MKWTILFVAGLAIIFSFSLSPFAGDPPHNAASGVSCASCHGTVLVDSVDSPFWNPDARNVTGYNRVCTGCHNNPITGGPYGNLTGPFALTHSPGGTAIQCTACHNNHDQDQIFLGKNDKPSFFIATATGTGLVEPGDEPGTTKIFYSGWSGSGDWSTPENVMQKTGELNRGAQLVPDRNSRNRWEIYMILDVVTGGSPYLVVKGTVASAPNIGIFYGQLINREINFREVRFWDRTGDDSFVNTDGSGICQVCHTTTDDWKNDGVMPAAGVHAGMSGASDCAVCHIHTRGLKHGGPGPTETCSDCHDSVAHPAHLDAGYYCAECHDIFNMRDGSSNILFKDGELLSGTDVCVNCHTTKPADWAGTACLTCHTASQGNRAAVGEQLLTGNSHHIQGPTPDDTHCYQCHWEADDMGHGVSIYHGGEKGIGDTSVNLVIWSGEESPGVDIIPDEGSRPKTYTLGTTAVEYTAGVSHAEIEKINDHCLGCHSDQNNSTVPFGVADGKTPRQYAWDGTSVDARYSQADTTDWGKYDSDILLNVTPKDKLTKAFSAHGNAENNEGGWDLNETWPNTRNGSVNVACFDCHNSHGSTVEGTTTSYTSAETTNHGILKDTVADIGGYAVDYKPVSGGLTENKNLHNAGAALCFDCHLTKDADDTPDTKPWSYDTTFGASKPIIGYFDSEFLAPGQTGSQQRYSYKSLETNAGGHFGASSELKGLNGVHDGDEAAHQIGGLCTPCHDPHGVSPSLGISNQQYAVPMLKGTWVTSPYQEDVAPANNTKGTVRDNTYPLGYDGTPREGVQYNIDQNTFGANIKASVTGITQTDTQFAGLCLNCHIKGNLTDGANGGAWTSVDRIHESVKGWGANSKHKYTCSKCHTPHNGSALPRLMVTNCLDKQHKGRKGFNPAPVLAGSGYGDDWGCYGDSVTLGGCPTYPEEFNYGDGAGRFPGSFDGFYYTDYFGANSFTVGCHESRTGNDFDQSWNTVTDWINIYPSLTSGPSAVIGDQWVLMHMDEAAWSGTPGQVLDSSGANSHGTAYAGANTVAGGITGLAGSFNGTNSYVGISYSPPVDNFTIEAWIKPTTTHEIDTESISGTGGISGQRYLFGADHKGAEGGAGISAGTNGISVYEHGSGYMPALAVYNGAISSTEWTHVAVVYANKRPSIYINGFLVHTGLQSLKAHVYAPTRIGGGSYGYFPGTVDEVAIYRKVLTGDDILVHSLRESSVVCDISEADIIWTTAYDSTSYVDYGLTTSYDSTVGSGTAAMNHSVTLSGLLIPENYHYRARSSNVTGEMVSGDYTFDINECPLIAPALASPTATDIESDYTATLGADIVIDGGASVTQHGTCWGATSSPTGHCSTKGAGAIGGFTDARTGLDPGTKIFYRGYATNSEGTAYSPDGTFYTEPLTQASGVSFSNVSETGMKVSWTRYSGSGEGDGVIVLMKPCADVDANPEDGIFTEYNANSKFGDGTQIGIGNYVIYKGAGTEVTVTGLAGGTTYYVAVYEYKGSVDSSGIDQGTNYKLLPARGSWDTAAISGSGPYTYTFNYTGTVQSLSIPAGVGGVDFTVKGAGGGGGRDDTYLAESGQNGHLVTIRYVADCVTLEIYVGGGGTKGGIDEWYGTPGGWGYHSGEAGGDGDDNGDDLYCGYQYGYGGAGGGGSSAILLDSILLAESGGGSGGSSSDWDDCFYNNGGAGGAGGGSVDIPGTTDPIGGGSDGTRGNPGANGSNGQVIITYGFPETATIESPIVTAITDTNATLGADISFDGYADITEHGTCWDTIAFPIANCSTKGAGSIGEFTDARIGLNSGTKLFYRGYATNSKGTVYSPNGSFYTEPSTQASSLIFDPVGATSLTIDWTRGNGDGVIVLMKEGAAVSSYLVDGEYTGYTDNQIFGLGTQIGSGNYVVYKGTGTSVEIIGLSSDTEYHVAVYEYKGAVDSSGVNKGTNYKSNPLTGFTTTGTGGGLLIYDYTDGTEVDPRPVIPANATNIVFQVKGGGGGGGRYDNLNNQMDGINGHLVATSYATTGDIVGGASQDVTLRIYVGGGGTAGGTNGKFGTAGGLGYDAGSAGGNGEEDNPVDYAYGGAGGGASSAILLFGTDVLQAKAVGGNGGRSGDWNWTECPCVLLGGSGGTGGGGTDVPGTTSSTGGGAGGLKGTGSGDSELTLPAIGVDGQVVITYEIP